MDVRCARRRVEDSSHDEVEMGPHPYPRSRGEAAGSGWRVRAAAAGAAQGAEIAPDELAWVQAANGAAEDLSVWLDTVARIVSRVLRSSSEDGAR